MAINYQSPISVYKYPFELVMEAYKRCVPKWPPMFEFVSCEVLLDETSSDTAVRNERRRCKVVVEDLLKQLIGENEVYFIQKSIVNHQNRTMTIEVTNESFLNKFLAMEKSYYYVHMENPDWTCFFQSATLDIKSFVGLQDKIKKLAKKQYIDYISKNKKEMGRHILALKEEGLEYVRPWTGPNESGDNDTSLSEADLGESSSMARNKKPHHENLVFIGFKPDEEVHLHISYSQSGNCFCRCCLKTIKTMQPRIHYMSFIYTMSKRDPVYCHMECIKRLIKWCVDSSIGYKFIYDTKLRKNDALVTKFLESLREHDVGHLEQDEEDANNRVDTPEEPQLSNTQPLNAQPWNTQSSTAESSEGKAAKSRKEICFPLLAATKQSTKRPLSCPMCNKTFGSQKALRSHLKKRLEMRIAKGRDINCEELEEDLNSN